MENLKSLTGTTGRRRAWRLSESRWVVCVAARHADHPSAAGAVRLEVKGDCDGDFTYVAGASKRLTASNYYIHLLALAPKARPLGLYFKNSI